MGSGGGLSKAKDLLTTGSCGPSLGEDAIETNRKMDPGPAARPACASHCKKKATLWFEICCGWVEETKE